MTDSLVTRLLALADLMETRGQPCFALLREAADALKLCQSDRNDLHANLMDALGAIADIKAKLVEMERWKGLYHDLVSRTDLVPLARAEKGEAEAAALLLLLQGLAECDCVTRCASAICYPVRVERALLNFKDRPGAAYQERQRKLEAVAEVAAEVAYGGGLKEHIGDKLHKAIAALEEKP